MPIRPALTSVTPAIQSITKNKVNLLLAFIPVFLGVLIYWFMGSWIYETVMSQGNQLIEEYISKDSWGTVIYTIAAALMGVMLFFFVNWTFVLVVTLIASPFNDLLSSRIEKQLLGQDVLPLGPSFKVLLGKIFYTIFNEVKKISFIVILTLLSFVFGYIPILAPIGVFIAVVLLSVEFLDYSWSRHDLRFRDCVKDLRGNLLGYTLGGGFFFMLVAVPILNLAVPALATSFFTVLWTKNNRQIP